MSVPNSVGETNTFTVEVSGKVNIHQFLYQWGEQEVIIGWVWEWYHVKSKFNDCFMITFLKQFANDTSLWLGKSLRTLQRQGA